MVKKSLVDILMDKCRKSFDEACSEYTYYDANGNDIYNMLSELNLSEVTLHDVITKNVFQGIDYYKLVSFAPLWVRNAGHSQEGALSQKRFEELVNLNENELTHKFLYYHDCEVLMSAFQNRTQVIDRLMNKIYEYLTPKIQHQIKDYEECVYGAGSDGIDVHTYINSLIITLASSFDLITKIAFELQEMPKIGFEKYPSMKCANITYGEKKLLHDCLKVNGTLFGKEEPICVKQVLSLRNEIIHNGSLDFYYSIYHGMIDGKIEHMIFFPDMTETGTLVCYKQRKKFYPDCTRTFNSILPEIVKDVIRCLSATLNLLNSKFDCEWTENDHEVTKYQKEILGWRGLRKNKDGTIHADWLKAGQDVKHQELLLKLVDDILAELNKKE